jgi:glycine/D-amino acid oxidase-like deaminating enzyme
MNRRTLLKLLSAPLITGLPMRAAGAKVKRVVISCAGIVGASIAYHLAQRGAEVTVLEKQRPGSGATRNSFAWFNASKRPQAYYQLNLMGMLGWRRLCTEIPELEIQWGGSVRWAAPGAGTDSLRRTAGQYESWSYPISLVDETEFARLLPTVTPGPFGAASFSSLEGTTEPMHALAMILNRAQQFGAKMEYPCEVTGLNLAGDRVSGVQTTRGPMEADAFVLASGVDTPRLAQMAGVIVPLKDSPGLLAHTAPQARILDRVALAPGADIKQNPDGRIVTGTDFGASTITDTSKEVGMKLLQNAERFVEKLKGIEVETVTLGHRVLPQDGFPILGFPERRPNLYIAALHSGMTMGPIIGQLAAMEILDQVEVDLFAPYRLSRFSKGAPSLAPGQVYPGRN